MKRRVTVAALKAQKWKGKALGKSVCIWKLLLCKCARVHTSRIKAKERLSRENVLSRRRTLTGDVGHCSCTDLKFTLGLKLTPMPSQRSIFAFRLLLASKSDDRSAMKSMAPSPRNALELGYGYMDVGFLRLSCSPVTEALK